MTRGDQIRACIHGLSELLESVDHEDMTVYLHQDELVDVRRWAEVLAQQESLGEWEN